MRFRYVMPNKKGRWHDTKEGALDAAVKAGFATRDEHTGQPYRDPYLTIEEKQ